MKGQVFFNATALQVLQVQCPAEAEQRLRAALHCGIDIGERRDRAAGMKTLKSSKHNTEFHNQTFYNHLKFVLLHKNEAYTGVS